MPRLLASVALLSLLLILVPAPAAASEPSELSESSTTFDIHNFLHQFSPDISHRLRACTTCFEAAGVPATASCRRLVLAKAAARFRLAHDPAPHAYDASAAAVRTAFDALSEATGGRDGAVAALDCMRRLAVRQAVMPIVSNEPEPSPSPSPSETPSVTPSVTPSPLVGIDRRGSKDYNAGAIADAYAALLERETAMSFTYSGENIRLWSAYWNQKTYSGSRTEPVRGAKVRLDSSDGTAFDYNELRRAFNKMNTVKRVTQVFFIYFAQCFISRFNDNKGAFLVFPFSDGLDVTASPTPSMSVSPSVSPSPLDGIDRKGPRAYNAEALASTIADLYLAESGIAVDAVGTNFKLWVGYWNAKGYTGSLPMPDRAAKVVLTAQSGGMLKFNPIKKVIAKLPGERRMKSVFHTEKAYVAVISSSNKLRMSVFVPFKNDLDVTPSPSPPPSESSTPSPSPLSGLDVRGDTDYIAAELYDAAVIAANSLHDPVYSLRVRIRRIAASTYSSSFAGTIQKFGAKLEFTFPADNRAKWKPFMTGIGNALKRTDRFSDIFENNVKDWFLFRDGDPKGTFVTVTIPFTAGYVSQHGGLTNDDIAVYP